MGRIATYSVKLWRCLFLLLETVVVFMLSLMVLQLGTGVPAWPAVPVALGIFNFVALFFLLLCSPLFFRSLGTVEMSLE